MGKEWPNLKELMPRCMKKEWNCRLMNRVCCVLNYLFKESFFFMILFLLLAWVAVIVCMIRCFEVWNWNAEKNYQYCSKYDKRINNFIIQTRDHQTQCKSLQSGGGRSLLHSHNNCNSALAVPWRHGHESIQIVFEALRFAAETMRQ